MPIYTRETLQTQKLPWVDIDDYEFFVLGRTPGHARPTANAGPPAVKVTVVKTGGRYVVRWTGSAASWLVTLKVGKTKATATVRGAVHTHTFTLKKAKGAFSAKVSSPALACSAGARPVSWTEPSPTTSAWSCWAI